MDFVNVSMLKIRVIFFSCENINLEVENIEKREQDKMKWFPCLFSPRGNDIFVSTKYNSKFKSNSNVRNI